MRRLFLDALVIGGAFTLAAASTHPNFDGTWNMDKARSQYPAESATEVIHQDEDAFDITITEKRQGHSNDPMQIHLTADGKPTVNTIEGNKFTSTTRWDHDKLVTFIEGDRGQHMTEVRELSSDGRDLTVIGYHQDALTKPYYIRVMQRSKP